MVGGLSVKVFLGEQLQEVGTLKSSTKRSRWCPLGAGNGRSPGRMSTRCAHGMRCHDQRGEVLVLKHKRLDDQRNVNIAAGPIV